MCQRCDVNYREWLKWCLLGHTLDWFHSNLNVMFPIMICITIKKHIKMSFKTKIGWRRRRIRIFLHRYFEIVKVWISFFLACFSCPCRPRKKMFDGFNFHDSWVNLSGELCNMIENWNSRRGLNTPLWCQCFVSEDDIWSSVRLYIRHHHTAEKTDLILMLSITCFLHI